MNNKEKALIKDLELQIDYLVGYCNQGCHWKREYYLRKELIDNTLTNPQTPQEVVDKINRIQNSIYCIRNKVPMNQDYVQETLEDYKQKHSIRVREMNGQVWYFEL